MHPWLEKIENSWSSLHGEEVVARLGKVPLGVNPHISKPVPTEFKLIRSKNGWFVRYAGELAQSHPSYIALRDLDQFQAILQEAARLAEERSEIALEEPEAQLPPAPVERGPIARLAEFALKSLFEGVMGALWGVALLWFLGTESLTTWLLYAFVGLILAPIALGVRGVRGRVPVPWRVGPRRELVGLFLALVGMLLTFFFATTYSDWVAATAAWLLAWWTPVELGMVLGILVMVLSTISTLLQQLERAGPLRPLVEAMSSGLAVGLLVLTITGVFGIDPNQWFVWVIAGGALAGDLLTGMLTQPQV